MIAQTPPGPPRNGWTPERRLKQAQAIQNWQPWTRSTGPKTAAGKRRASRNALKSGFRSAAMKDLKAALKRQRLYVDLVCAGAAKPEDAYEK